MRPPHLGFGHTHTDFGSESDNYYNSEDCGDAGNDAQPADDNNCYDSHPTDDSASDKQKNHVHAPTKAEPPRQPRSGPKMTAAAVTSRASPEGVPLALSVGAPAKEADVVSAEESNAQTSVPTSKEVADALPCLEKGDRVRIVKKHLKVLGREGTVKKWQPKGGWFRVKYTLNGATEFGNFHRADLELLAKNSPKKDSIPEESEASTVPVTKKGAIALDDDDAVSGTDALDEEAVAVAVAFDEARAVAAVDEEAEAGASDDDADAAAFDDEAKAGAGAFPSAKDSPPSPLEIPRGSQEGGDMLAAQQAYHHVKGQFLCLGQSGFIILYRLPTAQGLHSGTGAGCAVISLLSVHHLLTTGPVDHTTYTSIINEKAASPLAKLRNNDRMSTDDVSLEKALDELCNKLPFMVGFSEPVGGNILDGKHVANLWKLFEVGGTVAGVLYFMKHYVFFAKYPQDSGANGKSTTYHLFESLPAIEDRFGYHICCTNFEAFKVAVMHYALGRLHAGDEDFGVAAEPYPEVGAAKDHRTFTAFMWI